MLKLTIILYVLLTFFTVNDFCIGKTIPDIVKNESAPGARSAMGLFAHAFNKSLATNIFKFEPYSFREIGSNLLLSAFSYQILSYDTKNGLEIKPFIFNKEWKGYWTGYLAGLGLDLFLHTVRKYESVQFITVSSVLTSMGIVLAYGTSHEGWRRADDGPLNLKAVFKNRHSYWIHFAGSGGLYWALSNHTRTPEQAVLYTSMLIWLWEIKDGYLPWEDFGYIGGDGFSWRDGVAGSIASIGSYLFDKYIFPSVKTLIMSKANSLHKKSTKKSPLKLNVGTVPSFLNLNFYF